jgi:hypothetical protein
MACSKLQLHRREGGVQLFLNSWSLGLFGPISISETEHLFTKQLLCQLSYAGIIRKGNGTLFGRRVVG